MTAAIPQVIPETGLIATQVGEVIVAKWDFVNKKRDRVAGAVIPQHSPETYEVRVGPSGSWTYAHFIQRTKCAKELVRDWAAGVPMWIHVRAIGRSGFYADSPTSVQITPDHPAGHIGGSLSSLAALGWPGTLVGCEIEGATGDIVMSAGFSSATYTSDPINFGAVDLRRLGFFVDAYHETGLTFKNLDPSIGELDFDSNDPRAQATFYDFAPREVSEWAVTHDAHGHIYTPEGSWRIEWITSDTWPPAPGVTFQPAISGMYDCQYVQVRLALTRTDTSLEDMRIRAAHVSQSRPPAGSSSPQVPSGIAEYQHLEWNQALSKWEAVTDFTLPIDGAIKGNNQKIEAIDELHLFDGTSSARLKVVDSSLDADFDVVFTKPLGLGLSSRTVAYLEQGADPSDYQVFTGDNRFTGRVDVVADDNDPLLSFGTTVGGNRLSLLAKVGGYSADRNVTIDEPDGADVVSLRDSDQTYKRCRFETDPTWIAGLGTALQFWNNLGGTFILDAEFSSGTYRGTIPQLSANDVFAFLGHDQGWGGDQDFREATARRWKFTEVDGPDDYSPSGLVNEHVICNTDGGAVNVNLPKVGAANGGMEIVVENNGSNGVHVYGENQ